MERETLGWIEKKISNQLMETETLGWRKIFLSFLHSVVISHFERKSLRTAFFMFSDRP